MSRSDTSNIRNNIENIPEDELLAVNQLGQLLSVENVARRFNKEGKNYTVLPVATRYLRVSDKDIEDQYQSLVAVPFLSDISREKLKAGIDNNNSDLFSEWQDLLAAALESNDISPEDRQSCDIAKQAVDSLYQDSFSNIAKEKTLQDVFNELPNSQEEQSYLVPYLVAGHYILLKLDVEADNDVRLEIADPYGAKRVDLEEQLTVEIKEIFGSEINVTSKIVDTAPLQQKDDHQTCGWIVAKMVREFENEVNSSISDLTGNIHAARGKNSYAVGDANLIKEVKSAALANLGIVSEQKDDVAITEDELEIDDETVMSELTMSSDVKRIDEDYKKEQAEQEKKTEEISSPSIAMAVDNDVPVEKDSAVAAEMLTSKEIKAQFAAACAEKDGDKKVELFQKLAKNVAFSEKEAEKKAKQEAEERARKKALEKANKESGQAVSSKDAKAKTKKAAAPEDLRKVAVSRQIYGSSDVSILVAAKLQDEADKNTDYRLTKAVLKEIKPNLAEWKKIKDVVFPAEEISDAFKLESKSAVKNDASYFRYAAQKDFSTVTEFLLEKTKGKVITDTVSYGDKKQNALQFVIKEQAKSNSIAQLEIAKQIVAQKADIFSKLDAEGKNSAHYLFSTDSSREMLEAVLKSDNDRVAPSLSAALREKGKFSKEPVEHMMDSLDREEFIARADLSKNLKKFGGEVYDLTVQSEVGNPGELAQLGVCALAMQKDKTEILSEVLENSVNGVGVLVNQKDFILLSQEKNAEQIADIVAVMAKSDSGMGMLNLSFDKGGKNIFLESMKQNSENPELIKGLVKGLDKVGKVDGISSSLISEVRGRKSVMGSELSVLEYMIEKNHLSSLEAVLSVDSVKKLDLVEESLFSIAANYHNLDALRLIATIEGINLSESKPNVFACAVLQEREDPMLMAALVKSLRASDVSDADICHMLTEPILQDGTKSVLEFMVDNNDVSALKELMVVDEVKNARLQHEEHGEVALASYAAFDGKRDVLRMLAGQKGVGFDNTEESLGGATALASIVTRAKKSSARFAQEDLKTIAVLLECSDAQLTERSRNSLDKNISSLLTPGYKLFNYQAVKDLEASKNGNFASGKNQRIKEAFAKNDIDEIRAVAAYASKEDFDGVKLSSSVPWQKESVMDRAVRLKRYDIAQTLQESGVELSDTHKAILSGRVRKSISAWFADEAEVNQEVSAILALDPTIIGNDGQSLLAVAAKSKLTSVVSTLLKNGVEIKQEPKKIDEPQVKMDFKAALKGLKPENYAEKLTELSPQDVQVDKAEAKKKFKNYLKQGDYLRSAAMLTLLRDEKGVDVKASKLSSALKKAESYDQVTGLLEMEKFSMSKVEGSDKSKYAIDRQSKNQKLQQAYNRGDYDIAAALLTNGALPNAEVLKVALRRKDYGLMEGVLQGKKEFTIGGQGKNAISVTEFSGQRDLSKQYQADRAALFAKIQDSFIKAAKKGEKGLEDVKGIWQIIPDSHKNAFIGQKEVEANQAVEESTLYQDARNATKDENILSYALRKKNASLVEMLIGDEAIAADLEQAKDVINMQQNEQITEIPKSYLNKIRDIVCEQENWVAVEQVVELGCDVNQEVEGLAEVLDKAQELANAQKKSPNKNSTQQEKSDAISKIGESLSQAGCKVQSDLDVHKSTAAHSLADQVTKGNNMARQ